MVFAWHDVIFQQVFPAMGVVTGTFMSFAPYRAVLRASREGTLGDLNPTPWVFMLGNCIGWIGYSYLVHNFYIFAPNGPGVILAVWLNIQAIKLQYENYRSNELQNSIIAALEDKARKQTKFKRSEFKKIVEEILTEESILPEILSPAVTRPSFYEDPNRTASHNDSDNATGYETISSSQSSPPPPPTVTPFGSEDGVDDDDDDDGTQSMAESFIEEAAEAFSDYSRLIWEVAAQKSPAPASHELMVVAISSFWLVLVTVAALGQGFISRRKRVLLLGVAVNVNLIFFYGAPLSKIATVLRTKCSKSIHIMTMIFSFANGALWFIYGLAVNDWFVAVPNGFGAVLGIVQMVLCSIYPRHVHMPQEKDGLIYRRESSHSLSLPEVSTPLI